MRHFRLYRHLVFLRHYFWEAYRRRLLLSVIATFLFGSLIAIVNDVYYPSHIWDRFATEATISSWFCEFTDMNRVVRQPVNTFTNFIYLVLSIYGFSKGMEDIKRKRTYNLITANHFYSFVYSAIMLYVFISSSIFHASLAETASKMDFSAVYSITLFPLMYLTHRMTLVVRGKPTNVKHWHERLVMITVFSLLYVLLTFVIPMKQVHLIVGVIIFFIIGFGFYLEHRDPGQTNKQYLFATVVTIVLAGMFFEFDIKKLMCQPNAMLTPHSLWHLFNGMSIFFFYLYLRSERYDVAQDEMRQRIREKVAVRLQ
ncbi:MAG: ceramidase domain-containing protein [Chitinophagales bacterium]